MAGMPWGAVADMSKYEVYRATAISGTYAMLTETASASYTNTSLVTGATYYYKIRAYRFVGSTKVFGEYPVVVARKPVPGIPAVTAARMSAASIKLAWSVVSGTTKYEVYRATFSGGP